MQPELVVYQPRPRNQKVGCNAISNKTLSQSRYYIPLAGAVEQNKSAYCASAAFQEERRL